MNLALLSIMSLLTLAPVFGKETTTNHQLEVVKKPLRVETSAELPFPAEKVWKLIECRFPLRNYQAFVRLEAIDANKCRLHWGSVFTVEGATENEGDDLAKIIYQGCYDGIRRVLGK